MQRYRILPVPCCTTPSANHKQKQFSGELSMKNPFSNYFNIRMSPDTGRQPIYSSVMAIDTTRLKSGSSAKPDVEDIVDI
jgi:hypothetical protein